MCDIDIQCPGFLNSVKDNVVISVIDSMANSGICTCDLITLDEKEIVRRVNRGILDVRKVIVLLFEYLKNCSPIVSCENYDNESENRDTSKKSNSDNDNNNNNNNKIDTIKENQFFYNLEQRFITLGDEVLDSCFGSFSDDQNENDNKTKQKNRGIPTGCISEICGESGTGKSHLLMQLCATVQLPLSAGGLGPYQGKAIYISTESGLETRRLKEITQEINKKYARICNNSNNIVSTDNIYCIQCGDLELQDHILYYQLPVAIARNKIGLIAIDSIVANYMNQSAISRAEKSIKLSAHLTQLALKYNIAIVTSNQIRDKINTPSLISNNEYLLSFDSQLKWFSGLNWYCENQTEDSLSNLALSNSSFFKPKVPAMGLSWANCVTVRIILKKFHSRREPDTIDSTPKTTQALENNELFQRDELDGLYMPELQLRRVIQLVFSSYSPPNMVEFEISASGLKGKIRDDLIGWL